MEVQGCHSQVLLRDAAATWGTQIFENQIFLHDAASSWQSERQYLRGYIRLPIVNVGVVYFEAQD